MKIETVIPLRKDGTVKVTAPGGASYLFALDDQGRVVHDVEDQADIAWMLSLGDFFPAEEGDFDAAIAMTGAAGVEPTPEQLAAMDDAELDDEGDDPATLDAAPIEEPTPVVSGKKSRKAK